MSIYENEIVPHLQKGHLQKAERRLLEAMPHYLWMTRGGKKHTGRKTGLCTACGAMGIEAKHGEARAVAADALKRERTALGLDGGMDWQNPSLPARGERLENDWRHMHFGVCPCCGAVAQYRSAGMRRKYMEDDIALVRYARSAADPGTVVMALYAGRAYWWAFRPPLEHRPRLSVELREVCLMKAGTAGRRYVTGQTWFAEGPSGLYHTVSSWERRKECKSGYCGGAPMTARLWILDEKSVEEAFAGTHVVAVADAIEPFLHSLYYDRISLFNGILRWPCVEYLAKLGYGELAAGIVERRDGDLVNKRGKTAAQVLRLDGNTYGWLRGHRKEIPFSRYVLRVLQIRDKYRLHIGCDALAALLKAAPAYEAEMLQDIVRWLPAGQREKAIRYVAARRITPHDYRDHLQMMKKLEMDFADTAVTLPKDFPAMHAQLAERLDQLMNQPTDKRIARRLEKLGEYWFSALGFTLRPLLNAREVSREGTALRHCVANYTEAYALGNTVLLCLRADTAPDTPLYTVEYSKTGRRVQVRGYRNGMKNEDEDRLSEFWRLFELYRAEYVRIHRKDKQKRGAVA